MQYYSLDFYFSFSCVTGDPGGDPLNNLTDPHTTLQHTTQRHTTLQFDGVLQGCVRHPYGYE